VIPAGYENLLKRPQRFTVMDPDAEAVKDFIARLVAKERVAAA
jgi:hypothetical protein